MSVPTKLKDAGIIQFARRAAQLEKFRPIVAYWLRFYITQRIITKNLHVADAECTAYTTDLMNKLEQTKAEYPNEDAVLDDVAAYAYCEQFALQTFAKGEREMQENKASDATADTLLAASTFFELLSVWRDPPEAEVQSKIKFAKYHALRIVKARKAGEDPNLTNPKQETPPQVATPSALDPNDPDVQQITGGEPPPPMQNPYQSYVESAPDTSVQTSPNLSAIQPASPPQPNLPSAPTGYSQATSPPPSNLAPDKDVSPISHATGSRQGSVVSVGGGYFPRVEPPPTFTADEAAPSLPTAPSMEDEPMTSPYESVAAPSALQPPQAPPFDPQQFYQAQPSPDPAQQAPSIPQASPQAFPAPPAFQTQQQGLSTPQPPPPQAPTFQPGQLPSQQPYSHPAQPLQPAPAFASAVQPVPQASLPGPFKTDEDAISEATKHAKWAISALNFEDVNHAVKELKVALRALGAS